MSGWAIEKRGNDMMYWTKMRYEILSRGYPLRRHSSSRTCTHDQAVFSFCHLSTEHDSWYQMLMS